MARLRGRPGGRGEGNGRERCAQREYRKQRPKTTFPLSTWVERGNRRCGLPPAVMAPHETSIRPVAVEARSDDDHAGRGGRAIPVVVVGLVSMVIRLANHDLSTEVRITKTQRDADPCLSGRGAGSETEQQSNGEYAFHCPSSMRPS